MCRAMAAGLQQNGDGLDEKQLRRQLAATVRNIQWSYAIFWSPSARHQGVLAWCDGYYNGDIKTRKTTQPMEFKADQIGLQRSEQLRELFESLSSGDSVQLTKRPSASLSPEDLTDTEWYYLVCMSFTFSQGQGLPGKALASNQHIWLTNAPFADSKVFSRSLLAKSASIQTVVCFPFMGGVLELGTTELVSEDPALIQHVTTSFWELPVHVCPEQSISSPQMEEKDADIMQDIDHDVLNKIIMESHDLAAEVEIPLENNSQDFPHNLRSYAASESAEPGHDNDEELNANIMDELQIVSPDDSSNDYCPNQHADDSLRMEGLNCTSQIQSTQLMEDDCTNGLHNSLNSSNCISQCFSNPSKFLSSPSGERIKNNVLNGLQDGTKLISLDTGNDDSHYTRTLAAILRNSKQLLGMASFPKNSNKSDFTVWKRALSSSLPTTSTPQRLLKKVLVDCTWMHGSGLLRSNEDNGPKSRVWKPEGDDAGVSHVLSERRRREKLNEKFLVLRSLVPSISKVDKASILADTIEYVKELERRVEELESCRQLVELEVRERNRHSDVAERTSDNYGDNEISNGRKPSANKRKACSIDEAETENYWDSSKDGAVLINVTMVEKEVLVEVHCPWRECLLLEVVDAISNLHLDAHSVQSSTTDGVLTLTLKAKCRGSVVSSPGMIKRALQRVVGKC